MTKTTKKIISIMLTIPLLATLLVGAFCLPALGASEDMLKNGGFEMRSDSWLQANENYNISYPTGESRDNIGNFSARLAIEKDTDLQSPYLTQVVDVIPNTEYEYSVWVRIKGGVNLKTRAVMPVTYLRENPDGTRNEIKFVGKEVGVNEWQTVDNQWHRITNTFTTAPDMTKATCYIRVYADAIGTEVYFDDAQLIRLTDPDVGSMDTDQWIYYSDRTEDGTATVKIGDFYPEIFQDGTIDFTLKDGENIVRTSNDVVVKDGIAEFTYPMSDLAKKQHEYIIEAKISDKDGNERATYTRRIFKYDRPGYLNAEGQMVKDGKRVYPLWCASSHINSYWEPVAVEGGINVMPGGSYKTPELAIEALEIARANNVYLLLYMYQGQKLPSVPENAEWAKATVEAVKDHPNLFAYSIMDEPGVRNEITDDDMINAYTLIRDIDPNHPVYVTENIRFEWASKACDILGIDPYGRPEQKSVLRNISKGVSLVNDDKPVIAMVQAFKNGTYYPTDNEFRLSLYQGLLAGSKGLSLYKFSKGAEDAQSHLNTSPLWPILTHFEANEKELMYDHFVFGDTPAFNHNVGVEQDISYHSFVKDGEIYMIVANSSVSENKVSVPLTSYNGITITGYNAEVFSGSEDAPFTSAGSTLDVTMKPNTAVVYKIKPNVAPDFSSLTKEAYEAYKNGSATGDAVKVELTDIANYDWAKTEIQTVCEKGIANLTGENTFSPGVNITRGDFAYFLIRTLGLQSDSTENFDDVDVSAHYAKEIAIGKALGILNGIGDNKYNPEAEITRQDLMTIIARGMDLTGETDLAVFSDSALIADYAVPCVKAMIASGLIKGNADGTLNPIGNATRAEAAVIMYRILNK